jgi:N-acyl amino acid synthase of PEP-CTERM/exosortase system
MIVSPFIRGVDMSSRIRTYWNFLHDFKVIVADTPELRNIVYGIRYQVYCQELEFEPICSEFNQLEMDEYDSTSLHCLVQHRKSKEYIGCARVVLSDNNITHKHNLPFSRLFDSDQGFIQTLYQNHGTQPMIEISRLAIKAEFRKNLMCENTPDWGISELQKTAEDQNRQTSRNNTKLVSTSLYFVCALIADYLDIDRGYAMMEKRLVRHLRYCNINFEQVSDFIEHKGSRALFFVSTRSILDNVPVERTSFIQALRNQIMPSFCNRVAELGIKSPPRQTSSSKLINPLNLSA